MSKASIRKTEADRLIDEQKAKRKLFGLSRQNFSGLGSSDYGSIGTSGAASGVVDTAGQYLKVAGDTMIGPIAFYPRAVIISGGQIDIGSSTTGYSSRVIVTGEGAVDDDLDTILNAGFAGQFLILQSILTNNITLKHNTGNIFIPAGIDVVLEAGHAVIMQFDTVVHANKWVIIGGAGSGDNLGNHTAEMALDMATFNIANAGGLLFDSAVGGVQTIQPISTGLEFRTAVGNDYSWWINNLEEYTMNSTAFTVGTNRIVFGTNQDIFSSGSTLAIGAASGGFISLETNDLPRLLISDTYVQLNNSAAFRANGNPVYLDADNDTKWQAGTDDVAQLTIGGVTPSVKISVSAISTIISNTLIPSGNIDMNGADIINIDDLLFTTGGAGGHSITADGNGLTYDVDDGVSQGIHLFTKTGGITKLLGINEITNEITPYLDVIPGGTTDTLDLGAPANLWHHIYMGGSLFFRNLEAQAAGDDNFRIFRDADGMTWQLGLEGVSEFGKISLRDKDNVERVEFNWNSTDKLIAFNYLTGGLRIRQNASDLGGLLIMPSGNTLYSSQDFVIDAVPVTSFGATDGIQIRRNTQIKIDITDNITFNNITTFSPNADIQMGGNEINNTGNIDPVLDSTYDIGLTGTRYATAYIDSVVTDSVANGLGEAISLTPTAVNIITTAGQDINFLIGASSDYVMNDTAFSVLNNHPIIFSGSGYIQMDEQVGDPAAGTTSGKFYVKTVGGVAKPYFIGDGTAAVALDGGGAGGLPHDDNVVHIQGNADNSKTLRFDVSSSGATQGHVLAVGVTTAARTWTLPDATGEIPLLSKSNTWTQPNIFNGTVTFGGGIVDFNSHIDLLASSEIRLNNSGADDARIRFNTTPTPDELQVNINQTTHFSIYENSFSDKIFEVGEDHLLYMGSPNSTLAPGIEKTDQLLEIGGPDIDGGVGGTAALLTIQFINNDVSPANGEKCIQVELMGEDSASQDEPYVAFSSFGVTRTSGSEEGGYALQVRSAGGGVRSVIRAEGDTSATDGYTRLGFFEALPVQKRFNSGQTNPTADGGGVTQGMVQDMWDCLVGLGLIDES